MKNFVSRHYGFITGVIGGVVASAALPDFGLLVLAGSVVGGIYDAKPEVLKMDKKKPAIDTWVEGTLDKVSK